MQRARLPESACCMSRHLPSSFVSLRSLAGHAPAVLCVLLLALLSASLASQTRSGLPESSRWMCGSTEGNR
ncbi:hypothetical protein AB3459_22560, partial [Pseudomonas aeruginosa]